MTKDPVAACYFRVRHLTRASIDRGLTLIEVLVVVGIIILLITISLPAIQLVRETTRRTSCADKLRQLGIASQNFESSSQRLPSAGWVRELMPLLELNPDEIKSQLGKGEITKGLEILSCSSDTGATDPRIGLFSNFLGNSGVWGPLKYLEGPIDFGITGGMTGTNDEWIRSSSITDGLSNTALFAETLRGGSERLRGVWALPGNGYTESEFNDFIAACQSLPADPMNMGFLGDMATKGVFMEPAEPGNAVGAYFIVGLSKSMYNHALPPQNPSCFNGNAVFSAAITATSNHPTVNVVFCDGHVSNINPSIAIKVWQSHGSRGGGDSE